MAESFSNFAKTSLTTAINTTDLSIVLSDGSLFPTANFYIVIDPENAAREIIFVASRSSNTLTITGTGQRGNKGTTAATHGVGARVIHTALAHAIPKYYSIAPSSDTYIDSQNPTLNRDTSTDLVIGSSWASTSFCRRVMMTFDLSTLANLTVAEAKLRMVCTIDGGGGGAGTGLRAIEILRAYNASQVTWNVYSTSNNWTTAGAKSSGNDRGSDYFGYTALGSLIANGEVFLDITSLVKTYVDAGTTTLRIQIGTDASTADNATTFASLEHATAAYRPSMRVVVS